MVPVGELRCSEKKMYQCQFVQRKSMWTNQGLHPCLHGEKAPGDSPRTIVC